MEKYGFVYVWRDRKRGRFYVGSHWGREDDGYVCSSNWMRDARNRRPQDFRRRVVARVNTGVKELLAVEHKWLSFIKSDELGKKYYNLRNFRFGHWVADEASSLSVKEKLSLARKRFVYTDEHRKKVSEANKRRYSDPAARAAHSLKLMGKNKGKPSPFKGQKMSEEFRKKVSIAIRAKNGPCIAKQKAEELGVTATTYYKWLKDGDVHLSPEERELRRRKKLSIAATGKPGGFKGRSHPSKGTPRSDEVKRKISAVKKANNAARKAMMSSEQKVKPWETEGVSRSKWYRDRKAA